MKAKLSIAIVFAVLLASAAGFAQERYVRPVDEALQDKSFVEFRKKLIAAVERRDVKFLLSIVDARIKNSFGGDDGVAEFKQQWNIGTKNSKFWDEFLIVVSNGGRWIRDDESGTKLFLAPYTFQAFPDDLDAFEYSVIFGKDVNLRARPSADAPVVAKLSYNVVKITANIPKRNDRDAAEWYKVETLGGKSGWVKADFVRSPIDYRAAFVKKRGVWKMTAFIAGD
ncbi:MAG: SH3 domain-containing protein [Pyrinomonadaceae bacterium]